MFHTHAFILHEDSRTLYCSCGKVKQLPCSHDWKVHSEQKITYNRTGVSQYQQILICTKCGDIKSVNLTTGEIE